MSTDSNVRPQDMQAPATAEMLLLRKQAHLTRSIRWLWAFVVLVGMIASVSLAANVLLVTRLLALRNSIADTLTDVSHSLDNVAGQGITLDFPISQTVAFEGDVPIRQDLIVPFQGSFPISTVVSIPIDLGPLGKQTVNVPVNTNVPVDVRVPIHLDQSIPIKTSVPVRMIVPIRLGPNDPPLRDWIANARVWLESIRQRI